MNWDMFHNFKKKEFVCPCCGNEDMNIKLIMILDSLREICGFPIIINSGYRCELHNKDVGGKTTSSHLKGLAVDIHCTDGDKRLAIINTLLELGVNRIGIGTSFIHFDIDYEKDACIWVY